MAVIRIEPKESFEHSHAQESITYLMEGEVRYSDALTSKRLVAGEEIWVPAGMQHVIENVGNQPALVGCRYQEPPKKS